MTIDRLVMAIAGTVILLSLVMSQLHSLNWLWFTTFVGANLLQASFTGFCPIAKILKALGIEPGKAFE
jgi:hypothetical protein